MNGYIARYKGKPLLEVYANTPYEALKNAALQWGLTRKQQGVVTVVLCEKDGKQVTHIATE